MTNVAVPDVEEFRADVRAWLASVAETKEPAESARWGGGDDSVTVFDNWTAEEEAHIVAAGREWERQRFDAGWGAIAWPVEHGGRGLPERFADLYDEEEATFVTPKRNELFEVTRLMIAPTIAHWGIPEQHERFVTAFLRTDLLCCQLFSEPNAGSDLAGVATRAVRDGDDWLLTGQKVWTSGATSAEWGLAICRSDTSVAKHAGMTAFLVPMDAPGVTIRPIKQMSGGASFNEVFLDEARISETLRVGPEGAGWKVALTTLAAERFASKTLGGETIGRVLGLARHLGVNAVQRDVVVDLYIRTRVNALNAERVAQTLAAGEEPGPEGSIGRLFATQNMRRTSNVVSSILGPRLLADSGEWGTYAWGEQVLGAPGYRIAGGSEEIQRNIIGEKVLGLPREPRPPTPGVS